MKFSFVLMLVVSFAASSIAYGQDNLALPYMLQSNDGMVVCDSPLASRIGRDVFAKGGNAVDAAVATAFAMAVTWPEAGNIGGGGFMLVRPADGSDPVCIDYRETSPLLSKVDTFKATDSALTRKAVGVPGTVRGLELAHKKYGKLKWSELVLPAAEIAKLGFNVDQPLADSLNSVLRMSAGKPAFAELHKVYGKPDGSKWAAGETMKLPELGATLAEIANRGADAFYKGSLADLLVKEMKREDGMIRQADLDAYQAKIRKPVIGTFNGFEIIGAAPPSSGGICIVQALNIVEALGIKKDQRYSAETMHLLAETLRRVFLDRARHLGDPDFTEIPQHLTSKDYAKKLAGEINREKATDSAELAPDIKLAYESSNTTHFSIVDPDGMAVSNTYTLEASWGSRIVVPGAGYVLNNEMGDFNWVKGLTNTRGRIGTDPNLLVPGKRMLSSQCPVIVAKDGQLRIVTGSPGGRTIISTVFSIVLNHTYFGMSGAKSVASPRFHHQWMPDQLQLEWMADSEYEAASSKLEALGHRIAKRPSQGSAHSIFVDGNQKIGLADFRRSGRPASSDLLRLASWNFAEKKGLGLVELQSVGPLKTKWSKGITGAAVDGNENLSLRGMTLQTSMESYASIEKSDSSKVAILIHLNGVAFAGKSKNEQVAIGFTHNELDSGKDSKALSEVTASLVVQRNEKDEIVVRGEALGLGATAISSVVISKSKQLGNRLTLKLAVDTAQDNYSILIRNPNSALYQKIGQGKLAADRSANFLRLSVLNDFSAKGEFFNIDRIDVLKDVKR